MGRLTLLFLALISLGVLLPPDAAARSGCSTGYIQRGEECVPITSVHGHRNPSIPDSAIARILLRFMSVSV
jgi:hypothetical protein